MRKAITFLTVLSAASAFFAGCSGNSATVEGRLQSQYGWQGTLPKPAADSEAGKEIQQDPAVSPVIASGEQKPEAEIKPEPAPAEPAKTESEQKASPAPEKAPAEKKLTKADLSGETREHIVRQGESLWILALREYGNGMFWRWIYDANKNVIKGDPNIIAPGIKLRIPLLKKGSSLPAGEPEKPAAKKAPEQTQEKIPAK